MPEDLNKVKKIIRLMERAANADGVISPEEKKRRNIVFRTYQKAE
jgi:uncharacterized membrane protein YebE (DUF533 family)